MWIAGLLLEAELRQWRRADRRAVLWWRDDGARAPTPALERLLALSDAHGAPVTLAVIPDKAAAGLAPLLAPRPQVSIIQRGAHGESQGPDAAGSEFSGEMTRGEIAERLQAGGAMLEGLPGLFPAFAPRRNDIHPALPGALRVAGYRGLSAFGEISSAVRPYRIDAHLDLMRWNPSPRFRGRGQIRGDLRAALALRRKQGRWDAPLGLLTYHLAHDAPAWRFLGEFLAWAGRRPEMEWSSLKDLLAPPVAQPQPA
jgi:hypothetical protein